MKYATGAALLTAALVLGCATAQPAGTDIPAAGVVLKDTYLYTKAAGNDVEGKVKVNRGEAVTLLKEVKEQLKGWTQVMLADKETRGWMEEKYIHKGPKVVITLTQNSSLYVRPDADSKVLTLLPGGTTLLVLKQLEEWRKVSVSYEKEGWINTPSFVSGAK